MINQTLTHVTTADHQQIAVWKITDDNLVAESIDKSIEYNSSQCNTQNLLFIHGAFSDKGVCLGIASYFATLGHQCFIMEWRGHGSSSQPQTEYHLEDIGRYDVTATLSHLFNELKLDNLHCVTHSGGGICLTVCLTHHPEYIDRINSITLFACQAFAAANSPTNFLKLLTLKALSRPMKVVKGKSLKLGTMDESYYLLSQWMDWNLNQNFVSYAATPIRQQILRRLSQGTKPASALPTSSQVIDYRALMPTVTTPIYAICAKGDVLAPPEGCLRFLQAFKSSRNQYREFSRDNGDLDNYNHTRIFLSRHAAKEVWPTVREWIERHSPD